MDVAAPPSVVFRWLCQLRQAPYSYDWADNSGRRSPRQLTPGLDRLQVGQKLLVVTITSFARDEHLTGRATPKAARLYGLISLTYRVRTEGERDSRLVARLVIRRPRRGWETARYFLLAWGDLLMTRKQLLTLKELAEVDGGT